LTGTSVNWVCNLNAWAAGHALWVRTWRHEMKVSARTTRSIATVALALSFTSLSLAQKDPGVRGGPSGAGGPNQD
jgi:hypothetical protein